MSQDDAPPPPPLKRNASPTLMPMDSPLDELEEDDHTELAAAPPGSEGKPAPEPVNNAASYLALGDLPAVPVEAQRRGAVDTLYSAEWFGGDEKPSDKADKKADASQSQATVVIPEPPPPTSNRTLMLYAGGALAVLVLVVFTCAGGVGIGLLLAAS